MSTLSPQRCLNRQSIFSSNPNQISFVSQLRLSQVYSIMQKNLPICEKCKLKQKNHYCMEPHCQNKSLLCIDCDIKSINGQHYLHDFTFIAPLFSTGVFQNFYQLKQNFQSFQDTVSSEINKIYQYLQKLYKIQQISAKQLENLQWQQISGRFKQFEGDLKKMVDEIKNRSTFSQDIPIPHKYKIEDVFKNVYFVSEADCIQKEDMMRNQLMDEIEKLNWLQNPQKILSDLLNKNQIIFNSNSFFDQKSEIFIPSRKKISIVEIDSFFRNYNQLFTQNLRHHKVQVKIEPQLLNKPKFYEAFIYHFKQCQRLVIDNANISHLKTPLNFRKLKQLEFNCNVETDTFLSSRLENQNEGLQSFTIRKFRQEDIKILKLITGPCKNLKNLHIEFFNKTDLSYSKDLIDYLTQQSNKDLNQFVLKMRTQSEVKRLYGYLSKFNQYGDTSLNLNKTIIELLRKNPNLKKVQIEGVKGLDAIEILKILFQMKYLLEYKIVYENLNLMAELDHQMTKNLAIKIQKRKRVLASLMKMVKQKNYPNSIIHTIGSQFLV